MKAKKKKGHLDSADWAKKKKKKGRTLPSRHLCSDRQWFVPRQSRQRSGAPPVGAPPQTACTHSQHSLRKEPARRGWKCDLYAAPTDPPSNALHSEEEFVIIAVTIHITTYHISMSHNVPASFRSLLPSPTSASASYISPVFASCFDCACVGCTCVCTGASVLVFLQVVTMTTGAVVASDEVVAELRAASLRVVLTFVKV